MVCAGSYSVSVLRFGCNILPRQEEQVIGPYFRLCKNQDTAGEQFLAVEAITLSPDSLNRPL